MTGALILGALVLALIAAQLFLHRKTKSDYLALCEFWVFQPGDRMVDQTQLLDRMVGKNPYQKRGRPAPIGPAEGIILSDIRLHMALVLRSKNQTLFGRYRFEATELDDETRTRLDAAQSLIKVRYASDVPLKDKRHIQFVTHAADAVAELMGADLIYDVVQERFFLREALSAELSANPDATRVEMQVREVWTDSPTGYSYQTMGLRKIGLKELEANVDRRDQKLLVTQVMEDGIARVWDEAELPKDIEIPAHDDMFILQFEARPRERTLVTILRRQAK